MTSLKTSIKTITYLSDIGCLEIQGASLKQPIKNSANGWVREIGDKEEKLHYHCWLALPYFQVRKPGFNDSGIFGLINSIWGELTGGNGYTYLCKRRYVIDRDDDKALKAFIKRISYM